MDQQDEGQRPSRARAPEPADAQTLRTWRRIGLAAGVVALAGGAGALVVGLTRGGDAAPTVVLALLSLVAALVSTVFLRRVWSEPGHQVLPTTGFARRCSSAVVGLWLLGVALSAARAFGVPIPAALGATVAAGTVVAFAAMVVLAWLDRPDYARN